MFSTVGRQAFAALSMGFRVEEKGDFRPIRITHPDKSNKGCK